MNNLWKPAALAAYCNQGRSGSSLVDSGILGRTASLAQIGSWSQITGHKDRWAIDLDGAQYGSILRSELGITTTLTVTAWICPDVYSRVSYICGNRTTGGGFVIELNQNGVRTVGYWTANVSRSVSWQPHVWQHLAVRFTPSTTTFFWNGSQLGSVANTSISVGEDAPFRLWAGEFAAGTAGVPFIGKGADLCFWPVVLTDAEIKWLANPNNNVLLPSGSRGFPMSRLVN